jgi:hypothetical protein
MLRFPTIGIRTSMNLLIGSSIKKAFTYTEETMAKENGFMDIIKEGLGYVSKIITASILPPIAEGAEVIMKDIEERIMLIQKRMLRKISSLVIIGFGAVLLIFALFFFLTESLGWSKAVAFFSIGIIVFVTGLLLKIRESDR